MRKLPGLLVVVDPGQEHLAVAEARKLGIPIMALVDTNADPDPIDYVIPANDDAQKSVKLIIQALADSIVEKNRASAHEWKGRGKGRNRRDGCSISASSSDRRGGRMSSIPITPALVKELRERTGVGMAKCKEALDQAQGNIEEAISILRKAGMASAVKKEGRLTKEGMVLSYETESVVAIVEVDAETDFVVQNEKFREFCKNIAEEAAKTKPSSLETFLLQPYSKDPQITIDQYRSLLIQTIGENIVLRRIELLPKKSGESIGIYSHLGGKLLTAVVLEGSGEEALARDVGMHVAAAAPEYLSPGEVPQEVVSSEKEIAKVQLQGKPAHIMDKILEGKLNAFFDLSCLTRQKYIRDDSCSVGDFVKKQGVERGKTLKILRFLRWNAGK